MEPIFTTIWICLLSFTAIFPCVRGFDLLNPGGNITIRWDIISWTADGYAAQVNITNYQSYRPVNGWKLRWSWARKEIIWSIFGARVSGRGDCSTMVKKGLLPASCLRSPSIADLSANASLREKADGCCKGGVLLTRHQDPGKSTIGFQVNVGRSGTTNRTVLLPRNISFVVPGGGYSCGPARIVRPTRFVTPDLRRVTQAYVTWEAVCTYTAPRPREYRAQCCVSMTTYQGLKFPCPTCACSCPTQSISCSTNSSAQHVKSPVQCTGHMCPVNINWHLMPNNLRREMRYLVSVSNLNYFADYSDWILAVEHSKGRRLISVSNAHHRTLSSIHYNSDILWGIRNSNQLLTPFGRKGSTAKFALTYRGSIQNQNFSMKTYFNGHLCQGPLLP